MATLQEILNNQPSDAFKSWGSGMTVEPDGMLKTKPTATAYGPTQPPQPTATVTPPVTTPRGGTTPTAPTALANPYDSLMQKAQTIKDLIPSATGLTKTFGFSADDYGTGTGSAALDAYYKQQEQNLNQPVLTEEQLYKQKLKLFQKEIDATNKIYDQMVRDERLAGEGRLGGAAAAGARAGLLGSDFQATRENDVGTYNRQIVGGIQAERAAKIGGILGTVRKAAADELAAKNLARKEGADSLVKYYAEKSEKRKENLKKVASSLVLQGIDPTELSPEELSEITSGLGISEAALKDEYLTQKTESDASAAKTDLETRKAEADIAKAGRVELGEGSALLDAEGNVIYKNPKTYAPDSGATSSSSAINKALLGGGWTESEIKTLDAGVREYGLDEVLAQEKAAGASDKKIRALENAYGSDSEETKLTRENIASFYGLTDDDTQSSLLGFEYGRTGKEKIDSIESFINKYRAVGYTDMDILKILKKEGE